MGGTALPGVEGTEWASGSVGGAPGTLFLCVAAGPLVWYISAPDPQGHLSLHSPGLYHYHFISYSPLHINSLWFDAIQLANGSMLYLRSGFPLKTL